MPFTSLNRSFKQLSDKLCFILYISMKSVWIFVWSTINEPSKVSPRTRFHNHHIQVWGLVHVVYQLFLAVLPQNIQIKEQYLSWDSKNALKESAFYQELTNPPIYLIHLVFNWVWSTPKHLTSILSQILSSPAFAQLCSYIVPETSKWHFHLSFIYDIHVIVFKPKDRKFLICL